MKRNSIMRLIVVAVMAVFLAFAMAACGDDEKSEESKEKDKQATQSAELSDADVDVLMEEVAGSEIEKQYEKYMKDEAFADAEIFGIDRDGDEGKAYVRLGTGEYVKAGDKVYNVSGSEGEAIIEFDYTDNGPKLTNVEWSADGSAHDEWMKENFPEEYLKKLNGYLAKNKEGASELSKQLDEKAKEELGAPVENELQLNIDTGKGTYEIIKIKESGDPSEGDYKFETETVEKGKLSDIGS